MGLFKDKFEDKLKLAKEMIEKMGLKERQLRAVKKAYSMYSSLSDDGLEKIVEEAAETHMGSFVEMVAGVYAKKFSVSDLKAMIAFFDSPTGKRYSKYTSELENELGEVAIKWTNKIRDEIEERYRAESLKRKAEQGINTSQYIPPLNLKF